MALVICCVFLTLRIRRRMSMSAGMLLGGARGLAQAALRCRAGRASANSVQHGLQLVGRARP